MAKKELLNRTDLTKEKVFEIFKKHLGSKYELYETKLVGADFVIKKTGWTGISVRTKHKNNNAIVVFNGFCPSAGARILCSGLIPLLILHYTKWKVLVAEITELLDTAPEFVS
jgi:hypothetical protein